MNFFTNDTSFEWYYLWNAIEKQILDAFQEISLYVHSAFDSGIGIGVWETRSTTTPFIATHSLYKLPYNPDNENIVVITISVSHMSSDPDAIVDVRNRERLYVVVDIGVQDGPILTAAPLEVIEMSGITYSMLSKSLMEKLEQGLVFLNEKKATIVQQLSLT